ncbi:hypothetical protein IWX92DRAFT_373745 [Phyllosticta citricarpa]
MVVVGVCLCKAAAAAAAATRRVWARARARVSSGFSAASVEPRWEYRAGHPVYGRRALDSFRWFDTWRSARVIAAVGSPPHCRLCCWVMRKRGD